MIIIMQAVATLPSLVVLLFSWLAFRGVLSVLGAVAAGRLTSLETFLLLEANAPHLNSSSNSGSYGHVQSANYLQRKGSRSNDLPRTRRDCFATWPSARSLSAG